MPPASQFVTAAAWLSTHVTVRLAPQAEAGLNHSSHASAPSSLSKSTVSPRLGMHDDDQLLGGGVLQAIERGHTLSRCRPGADWGCRLLLSPSWS